MYMFFGYHVDNRSDNHFPKTQHTHKIQTKKKLGQVSCCQMKKSIPLFIKMKNKNLKHINIYHYNL